MTAAERIASLEEQLKQALEQVRVLEEQLAAANKRIEELEKQKTPPPAYAKANVKKPQASEKKSRKKRAAPGKADADCRTPHRVVSGVREPARRGQHRSAATSDRVSAPSPHRGNGARGLSWLV
jgi:hypothetical protein